MRLHLPLMGLAFLLAAAPMKGPVLGDLQSLAKELIQFNAPPGPDWVEGEHDPAGNAAVFTTTSHEGQMKMLVLPKDAAEGPNAAVAIVKNVRAQRIKAGVKVVMPATVEKDSRFSIRIHEKYQVGDKVEDELNLYRSVGPRLVELVVGSLSDDPDTVTSTQKMGEDVLLSAKYNRKAAK